MSDNSPALIRFARSYAGSVLLALLLHGVLLAALLQTNVTPLARPPVSEPIVSYLYQPPRAEQPAVPEPAADTMPQPDTVQPAPAEAAPAAVAAQPTRASPQQSATAPLPDMASKQQSPADIPAVTAPRPGLMQRALNRAATVAPEVIQQAAAANYQQLLQAQQQPKMTVEKRHQQLSTDPAGQVFAQLDNGLQLIRTKGGCRFADPSKDGFDALMAANAVVPCGDEENSSALLQQALEKHRKR